jgi:anti-sigma factor RsiW
MDLNELKTLINQYWDGATTLEEERAIKHFFSTHSDLPTEIEQWRKWFATTTAISHAELSEDFDARILASIEKEVKVPKYIPLFHRFIAVAASVAILLCAYLGWIKTTHHEEEPQMTYEEAQEIMDMTKAVLYFTSAKMNQAETILQENMSKIDRMNEYIKIE